jgi:hypothetical protein
MVPRTFRSARVLRALNVVAVGSTLAALVAIVFGTWLDMPSAYSGVSTALVGMAWAWVLRLRQTVGKTSMRLGWLLSLPLAIGNAMLASALTFTLGTPDEHLALTFFGGAIAGATIGAIFWVPCLVLTLLVFGLPIAWSQRLAEKGLAGEERGERVVGVFTLVLSMVALFIAREAGPHAVTNAQPGILLGQMLACLGVATGGAAAVLAQIRESQRRAFVARAEAGEVRGFRVEAHDEGKVLVRVTSQGQGYRVADFQEEIYLLDEEGRATKARSVAD